MQTTAKLNHLRQSPRKVRLVANAIRGLDISAAQDKLRLMNRGAAPILLKLLKSAAANAKNNFDLAQDNLFIKEIKVNEGQTLKRWMPRAFGRASAIGKRTSHIDLILAEKVPTAGKKDKADGKNKEYQMDTKIVKSLDELRAEEKAIQAEAGKKTDEAGETGKEKYHYKPDKSSGKKGWGGWKEKIFSRKAG